MEMESTVAKIVKRNLSHVMRVIVQCPLLCILLRRRRRTEHEAGLLRIAPEVGGTSPEVHCFKSRILFKERIGQTDKPRCWLFGTVFGTVKNMVLWVFGYGSLLWKAGFEYDARMIGFIKDYRRVFYQASTDHRGTPEYPGRVVTLEAKEGEVTWGAAYRVSGHDNEKLVLSYLDLREQEYDLKAFVNLYTVDCFETPALCNVLVYIGSSDISRNKFWAGPAPLEVMAEQIAQAVGPSGPNYEYLFLLEESLGELDCVDEAICELAAAVRKHMNSSSGLKISGGISGTNLTTETQSISSKQRHDVCNGV